MSAAEGPRRITARVSFRVHERLMEAAELAGTTVNQFLVQAALEKAERIIDRERLIKVTCEDVVLLIEMLENPSKPNAALERAFERHESDPAISPGVVD